jgi:ketosteroid isomerase-like protein
VRRASRSAFHGNRRRRNVANDCCWVCRFDDEMIVEVRAYLDSAMVDYIIHRNENLAWQ